MTKDPFAVSPVLTMEQLEGTAEGFLDDLQRAANRAVRRNDMQKALALLEAIELVRQFVYTLKMVANAKKPVKTRVYSCKAPSIRIYQPKKGEDAK